MEAKKIICKLLCEICERNCLSDNLPACADAGNEEIRDECFGEYADHLIAHGVMIAPEIPGPREDNHNMAELCFRNGEEHFREKVINKLMDMQTNVRGVQYAQLVALVEIVRCL